MSSNQDGLSLFELNERLKELETRMNRIEKGLANQQVENKEEEELSLEPLKNFSEGMLSESKIGESGLAWLGNIVLFLGITFFEQYIENAGYPVASALFGYASVTGIFVLSYFIRTNFSRMAFIFNLNAYILLFYVTLRLHFFTSLPVVGNKYTGLILLFLVTLVLFVIALRKSSKAHSGIGLIFLAVIAVVSNSTPIMLPTIILLTALATLFLFRFAWIGLFQISIIVVYLVFLMWFLNNPLMGNPMQAIQDHQMGYIYLFAVAAIFSLVAFVENPESVSIGSIVTSIVMNGLGFSVILSLIIITFFKDDYSALNSVVSLFCLLYAIGLQLKTRHRIPPALYALYGFVTLSIAVYGIYGFPRAYFLLAIQSLLVVSMAIWFRSKFIVGMNTLLFILLLAVYAGASEIVNSVNISFSLAALFTARILNWKKERLTIKTDMLRNVYLLLGFSMVLVTLFHLMPDRFITLSWVAAGLFYFILSLILKNVKYRYMALATLISAAVYLFIVDLARIELVYRIFALMFLAVISIGLSIYYSRRSKRKVTE